MLTKYTIRFKILGFDNEGESHTLVVWRHDMLQAMAAVSLFASRIINTDPQDLSSDRLKISSVWATEDKKTKSRKIDFRSWLTR